MQCNCDCTNATMNCAAPDAATVNMSTLVLSALAYYCWKRGLEECADDEAPESMSAMYS